MPESVLRSLRSQLEEIESRMAADLEHATGQTHSEQERSSLTAEAKAKLRVRLKSAPPMTSRELTDAWLAVLSEFGPGGPAETKAAESTRPARLHAYIRTFIVPTLVNKGLILYFGIQYSNNPDEGYGYGLAITVSLTLIAFGYFVWLNWEESEN